jgi:hypothetical protein
MSNFAPPLATAGPAASGGGRLATASMGMAPGMAADPAVTSGESSLTASSSNSTQHAMTSGSGPSRERGLASSSFANHGPVPVAQYDERHPSSGDQVPYTWDQNGVLVHYPVSRHSAVLPFPPAVLWESSHKPVIDSISTFYYYYYYYTLDSNLFCSMDTSCREIGCDAYL